MYEFLPYITADYSVGLYNSQVNDIYHSATGALTESYEKFIYPINFESLLANDNVKVLDICYGIGYNTKCFLNFILENFSNKKNNIHKHFEAIYTDKNLVRNNSLYTEKIYSHNIFDKISITAVDNDQILTYLSPIIKTYVKKTNKQSFKFELDSLNKYLKNKKLCSHIKIDKIINYFILYKTMQKHISSDTAEKLNNIFSNSEYDIYFENDLKAILTNFIFSSGNLMQETGLIENLHNIYYKYISNCYKNKLKTTNLGKVNFNIENIDARQFIKKTNDIYNLIFLDAFSPNKCPCLWTYDFFKELYHHLHDDGLILTYSSSAAIRNAMINAGFKIGYIFNKRLGKNIGTLAVKNSSMIKYPLSEFDFGLLKTKAGIFYRDANLNAPNKAIIEQRNDEVKKSSLISSSKFIKDKNNLH